MKDTPEWILKKQFEIIFAMPEEKRVLLGFHMMEDARKIVVSGIKAENPGISEIDLRLAVFRRYYHNDFPLEKMEAILQSMRAYYEKQI